jgi:hypothetical protein
MLCEVGLLPLLRAALQAALAEEAAAALPLLPLAAPALAISVCRLAGNLFASPGAPVLPMKKKSGICRKTMKPLKRMPVKKHWRGVNESKAISMP